ncbi:MAG: hypothetical protein WCK54_18315 [Desulfuromonadales bacterium]
MNNQTSNISPATLETLKLDKLCSEGEALTTGMLAAYELIEVEPDYALLCELHDNAIKWRNSEDVDYTTFLDLTQYPAALNFHMVNGFFDAVEDIFAQVQS